MTSGVTLPLWLVVLGAAVTLWALLDRLLVPSVRWFLRSRANRVLDEVGQRLWRPQREVEIARLMRRVRRLIDAPADSSLSGF